MRDRSRRSGDDGLTSRDDGCREVAAVVAASWSEGKLELHDFGRTKGAAFELEEDRRLKIDVSVEPRSVRMLWRLTWTAEELVDWVSLCSGRTGSACSPTMSLIR